VVLCAADPANPYGAILKWPRPSRPDPEAEGGRSLQRAPGAYVVLVDGELTAYARRQRTELWAFLPSDEPVQSRVGRATAERLAELARRLPDGGLVIATINELPVAAHPLAPHLLRAGFFAAASGYRISHRPEPQQTTPPPASDYARYQTVPLESESDEEEPGDRG
jgi:ATP-dependent Lhr-like helicase